MPEEFSIEQLQALFVPGSAHTFARDFSTLRADGTPDRDFDIIPVGTRVIVSNFDTVDEVLTLDVEGQRQRSWARRNNWEEIARCVRPQPAQSAEAQTGFTPEQLRSLFVPGSEHTLTQDFTMFTSSGERSDTVFRLAGTRFSVLTFTEHELLIRDLVTGEEPQFRRERNWQELARCVQPAQTEAAPDNRPPLPAGWRWAREGEQLFAGQPDRFLVFQDGVTWALSVNATGSRHESWYIVRDEVPASQAPTQAPPQPAPRPAGLPNDCPNPPAGWRWAREGEQLLAGQPERYRCWSLRTPEGEFGALRASVTYSDDFSYQGYIVRVEVPAPTPPQPDAADILRRYPRHARIHPAVPEPPEGWRWMQLGETTIPESFDQCRRWDGNRWIAAGSRWELTDERMHNSYIVPLTAAELAESGAAPTPATPTIEPRDPRIAPDIPEPPAGWRWMRHGERFVAGRSRYHERDGRGNPQRWVNSANDERHTLNLASPSTARRGYIVPLTPEEQAAQAAPPPRPDANRHLQPDAIFAALNRGTRAAQAAPAPTPTYRWANECAESVVSIMSSFGLVASGDNVRKAMVERLVGLIKRHDYANYNQFFAAAHRLNYGSYNADQVARNLQQEQTQFSEERSRERGTSSGGGNNSGQRIYNAILNSNVQF